ncbi:single-stranded DNA-binding protein [Aeromicrobium sp. CF3.5]|uniref:single-stranded DNA-binding protein n=1 Tax=Aeromicrobium sp. CF3.5 TaxID=3373078 RepID=UPI003EE53A1E
MSESVFRHLNRVELVGRVSALPQSRTLPSGDEVVSIRIIVDRSAAARRRSKQLVDTFECSAWTVRLRRRVARLSPGDVVQVHGTLRRQFSRGAAGPISRVTVDLTSVTTLESARR